MSIPLHIGIPFGLAMAAYVGGGVLAGIYLRGGGAEKLDLGRYLAAGGNCLLLLVFVLRWYQFRLIPFTGLADSLNLFLILCTGIAFTVQRGDSMRALLAFYLPALATLAAISAVLGFRHLGEAPMGELNGALLTIHVGLVFLAMASFFVASLTSMVYIFQAQRLKRHRMTGLSQRLPSLEQLDRTLFRLITIGYPIFLVTIGFGVAWSLNNPELLGPRWYLEPKYIFTVSTLVLFAASFYIRRAGLLRGPKLAYLLFIGFTTLLASWIVLEIVSVELYGAVEAAI